MMYNNILTESSFQCEKCENSFSKKANLERHMQKHNKVSLSISLAIE